MAIAFSSQADAGSREENALRQKDSGSFNQGRWTRCRLTDPGWFDIQVGRRTRRRPLSPFLNTTDSDRGGPNDDRSVKDITPAELGMTRLGAILYLNVIRL
ncbi:hypothetical protein [Bradyrhizobium sp.]|uniref:hypothetical protein n=1 Tax=Bradyrhizobium sp. TaxID=376 RepID=UPI003C776967